MDYYTERKYCPRCKRYVRFLMSTNHSYCVDCDHRVQIFSKDDLKKFLKAPVYAS